MNRKLRVLGFLRDLSDKCGLVTWHKRMKATGNAGARNQVRDITEDAENNEDAELIDRRAAPDTK